MNSMKWQAPLVIMQVLQQSLRPHLKRHSILQVLSSWLSNHLLSGLRKSTESHRDGSLQSLSHGEHTICALVRISMALSFRKINAITSRGSSSQLRNSPAESGGGSIERFSKQDWDFPGNQVIGFVGCGGLGLIEFKFKDELSFHFLLENCKSFTHFQFPISTYYSTSPHITKKSGSLYYLGVFSLILRDFFAFCKHFFKVQKFSFWYIQFLITFSLSISLEFSVKS